MRRALPAVLVLLAALGCGGGTGAPLVKEDLVVGTGAEATANAMVRVHYTGWLADGTEFESSKGGRPLSFRIGTGTAIKGWDQGVVGMKVGGKRKLVIPPDLAYGSKGSPSGKVPPGATLTFEVELVEVL